jgi:hypothetical protein
VELFFLAFLQEKKRERIARPEVAGRNDEATEGTRPEKGEEK